jgi:hypothetical protein
MTMWTGKAARNVFWSLLVLLSIANMDSSHFFPLAGHSDLQFQVIGEGLEILALVLVSLLIRMFVKEGGDSEPFSATFRLRILLAGFFAIILLTIFWRDFFPNNQFALSAGSRDFLYAPLGGLGIIVISYVLGAKQGKPNQEEEKSVV